MVAVGERLAAGVRREALAVAFGVTHWTIRNIAPGKSWTWATGVESVPARRTLLPRTRRMHPPKQHYMLPVRPPQPLPAFAQIAVTAILQRERLRLARHRGLTARITGQDASTDSYGPPASVPQP